MGRLIIAEKPDLGKNIARAISDHIKWYDGYCECGNYIVTWAFGHLFGLIDVEEYNPDYDESKKYKWSMEQLPFYPEEFRFDLKKKDGKYDTGVKKQFDIIKILLERNDISEVIHAGDSDREGELIIRLILEKAKNSKPVKRLWIPDQSPETILAGLENMKDDNCTEYSLLAKEALARTYWDWLYGINLTRFATLKAGGLLRIGSVISVIIRTIYDREKTIEEFKPQPYLTIQSESDIDGNKVVLTIPGHISIHDREIAEKQCQELNQAGATVSRVEMKDAVVASGKLYSQTKLQNEMGSRYKISPADTLQTVQHLYEKGYVTYPRTNSEYLGTAEASRIKGIIDVLSTDYPVVFKDGKKIFDDSKIESHSAITPTKVIPDFSELSDIQQKVYAAIRDRFIAVFCAEDCIVSKTSIYIQVGEYELELKGETMKQPGWRKYDHSSAKDKLLPLLKTGDRILVDFKPVEKKTTPPARYTIKTLNNYLMSPKSAATDEGEDAEVNYKELLSGIVIGTEATRAGIIDNAVRSGYIMLKDSSYYITDKGKYYVSTLQKLGISTSIQTNITMNQTLKKINLGELGIEDAMKLARESIDAALTSRDSEVEQLVSENEKKVIGKCPECGHDIVETDKSFGCTNWKNGCKYAIWKNDKYFAALGKKVTMTVVKQLLQNGVVKLPMKSKMGKPYSLSLRYKKNQDGYYQWEKVPVKKPLKKKF